MGFTAVPEHRSVRPDQGQTMAGLEPDQGQTRAGLEPDQGQTRAGLGPDQGRITATSGSALYLACCFFTLVVFTV